MSTSSTEEAVVERLRRCTTATISDAQKSFGIMRPTVKSLAPGMHLVGAAYTVKCYTGSIITVHKAFVRSWPWRSRGSRRRG
jgi:regulator of RNase E activity RraA